MYRKYPYLQDSYYEDANTGLTRRAFLSKLDKFVNQKRYVRLTLLDWNENPIKEIQGEITGGNISMDGSSSVRRTCTLSTSVSSGGYSVDDAEDDFAINKKVFVEVGIENHTTEYKDYPILWFPQGVFFIKSCSCNTSATSAVAMSLSLIDKMAMLNGVAGGTFPATTILDEEDTQLADGSEASVKVPIYRIIQEVVNHFGNEDLTRIVIEDVDLRIKRIVRWMGTTPLYMWKSSGTQDAYYEVSTEKPEDRNDYRVYETGMDVGYVYDDLVWTGSELTANAKDTCVTVLDKIKQYLGNYEYFYDVFGVFHFREIKNYLNTTQATLLVNDMNENNYLVETAVPKSIYTFEDDRNLLSINVTPQYENIKNDFIVQGERKNTITNVSSTVRYHLAIDKKPKVGNHYSNILIYKELGTNTQKAVCPRIVASLPSVGDSSYVYMEGGTGGQAYVWNDSSWKKVETVAYYEGKDAHFFSDFYTPTDWRTELYMQGVVAKGLATDKGYYYEELEAFWPQMYDLVNHRYFAEDKSSDGTLVASLYDGNFFLDIIDSQTSPLGKYSVSNIGRRTDVVTSNDVNCLFEPEIPDVVFLNADLSDEDANKLKDLRDEATKGGQSWTQVRGDVYGALATGGYHNDAFNQVAFELYTHTTYQRTVSLTSIPVYYLEPNLRVTINDKTTNTYGDFMIQNLSIPFDVGGTMSVTLNECVVKR